MSDDITITVDARLAEMVRAELKLRAELTAERERADKAEKALLVPGEMRCAKCKFTLIRTNLYVKSGTTGPGGNDTEPCPNGCGPLWPETWERSARDAWARLETAHDELIAERERADRAEADLERERMRLAACSAVALSNTAETAAKARDMHPDYDSASVRDVAAAVDREMALRERVARLVGALTDACERMERARNILKTPQANWAMLDTTALRTALEDK